MTRWQPGPACSGRCLQNLSNFGCTTGDCGTAFSMLRLVHAHTWNRCIALLQSVRPSAAEYAGESLPHRACNVTQRGSSAYEPPPKQLPSPISHQWRVIVNKDTLHLVQCWFHQGALANLHHMCRSLCGLKKCPLQGCVLAPRTAQLG